MSDNFNFSMSLDNMQSTCINKIALLRNDVSELTDRGVDGTRLDKFDSMLVELSQIPTDEVQTQFTAKVYEQRDVEAETHRNRLKDIQSIVKNAFTEKSWEYKSFGLSRLSQMSAVEMFTITPNVIKQSNLHFLKLQPFGLTAVALSDLSKGNDALLTKITDTAIADGDAIAITGQRHDIADAVFTELRAMCGIAYSYFEIRDPARSKMYVIYNINQTYTVREGKIDSKKIANPKAENLSPDTPISIKLYLGQSVEIYFGKTKKEMPGTNPVVINYDPDNFTDFTAAQLGYNKTLGNIILNIYNPDSNQAWFKIKIGK